MRARRAQHVVDLNLPLFVSSRRWIRRSNLLSTTPTFCSSSISCFFSASSMSILLRSKTVPSIMETTTTNNGQKRRLESHKNAIPVKLASRHGSLKRVCYSITRLRTAVLAQLRVRFHVGKRVIKTTGFFFLVLRGIPCADSFRASKNGISGLVERRSKR